ncbi:MAG TPA: hypothetical protein V6D11_14930 [Waterburya sp.]|jgi:hypothetical protein
MARLSEKNQQPQQQSPLILPPNTRTAPPVDFDEDKVPVSQRLGDFSDNVFGFTFSPNTIKFGILLFAGFCVAINLSGYYDLLGQIFNSRLDEYGRTLPVDAPVNSRIISSLVRFPILGTFLVWLDKAAGGIVALIGSIAFWFVVQGLEIAGRFHLYLPEAAENLLYKQNRKRYETPANNQPATRKAYKLASGETMAILRWLSLAGILAYLVDAYAMHVARPWIDRLGNPLWINIIWNGLAVLGVELALVLYRGYKAVTLSAAEKADRDRL